MMTKEEIEELKDFTIDINDIDELALGLEVCSKKSNMVIQEFADLIIELQQENKQLEDNWNKLRETLKNEQLGSILYNDRTRFADIDEILLKMQELEKSKMK